MTSMPFRPGPRNLITDVAGLRVGNAMDRKLKSGVTAIICDEPAVASAQVLGGAPGTRETDLLEPHNAVDAVNGIVLSGGSAYGLDASSGALAALREKGMGFLYGGVRVPIVPSAILFDLVNGGDKDWGAYPPYRELGYEAAAGAAMDFPLGTVGAGAGALTAGLKGGLGSASTVLPNGVTVGALVAANPRGAVTVGAGRHFWAAPFELDSEFGGLGLPHPLPADAAAILDKFPPAGRGANTTLGVIATDARLTKGAAKRLAIAAHDGFARAIWPAHLFLDGDIVFALSTGRREPDFDLESEIAFYAAATATMARAIARAVHAATPEEGDLLPTWSMRAERG